MLNEKVTLLARKLIARGIKPIRLDKWTEFSDPSIWITESIYIQVGVDYTMIFRDRPTGLTLYEASEDIDDVIGNLRKAIDEGR
jgi:hypothetical protein